MSWLCSWWQRVTSIMSTGASTLTRCEANLPSFSSACTGADDGAPGTARDGHSHSHSHSHAHTGRGRGRAVDTGEQLPNQHHPSYPGHQPSPCSSLASQCGSNSSGSGSNSNASNTPGSVSSSNAPFSMLSHTFNSIIVRSTQAYYQQEETSSPTKGTAVIRNTVPPTNLFDLPDDLLREIVRHLTHRSHDSPSYPAQNVVEPTTYASGANFALASRGSCRLFYDTLDDVSLASIRHGGRVASMLAMRSGHVLKRLVLRGAKNVSNDALVQLARHARQLKCLDLSFIETVTSDGLIPICEAVQDTLRFLLLRKCTGVDDKALTDGVAKCRRLETLDMSYCFLVSDIGLTAVVRGGSSDTLTMLAVAHCPYLTNATFAGIGQHCRYLRQLCARGLPDIDNDAVALLCDGRAKTGWSLEGIDVTLCQGLKRDTTLNHLQMYCPRIARNLRMAQGKHRSLKQVIISSLRANIFIVHGSDPESGKDTVHTVVIDNGDLVSASLLSSGTTDLSLLGIVLCKSYGSSLSNETKQLLEIDYGIPSNALSD